MFLRLLSYSAVTVAPSAGTDETVQLQAQYVRLLYGLGVRQHLHRIAQHARKVVQLWFGHGVARYP